MCISEPEQDVELAPPRIFATTHWSTVFEAGAGESEAGRGALEKLCHAYWYPIYVYVRRKGYGHDDAKDLTQTFFAELISKEQLRFADPNKGKFRSFLLATLHFFLAREWSRAHRLKRGGQFSFVPLQGQSDDSVHFEPADADTPEKQFERQWARTVLKEAMQALEAEYAAVGKSYLFSEVKHLLAGERDGAAYATIGSRVGKNDGTLRVAVHRMRQRFGELLRAEIARTVNDETEVDAELKYLLRVLSH